VLGATLAELAAKGGDAEHGTGHFIIVREVIMSAAENTGADMKLEVVVLPVSDADRSKRFYQELGWRLDADFEGPDWRIVQLTPPGSPCSVQFGKGITNAAPGSLQGTYLVVDNLAAARTRLLALGTKVSDAFHYAGGRGPRVSGPDPQGRSYASFASFDDPDGNSWLLQEIKTRLPGRGFSTLDVPDMIELLREAEQHHGPYESTAPKHHWSDFYGAYIVARGRGKTPDEAVQEGVAEVERTRDRVPI
jgi:catechol 2,3-dioxygenase-like lactoylglutathione lyase family enzyme